MGMRVLAAAALSAGTLVLLGAPATAQTYPPPVRSITVDDATPMVGQSVTVTMRTCKPGTRALFGLDLLLLGSARVDSDGAAVATIRIPAFVRPGRHAVVGVCLAPDGTPLVLHTDVRVTAAPASGKGAQVPPPAAPAGGGGGGGGGGAAAPMPALGGLRSAAGPSDQAGLFADAGAAAGVPAAPGPAASGSRVPTAGSGVADDPTAGGAPASRSGGADDASPWATAGRVALGLAALGGVPVAMAFNRRPRAAARRSFA